MLRGKVLFMLKKVSDLTSHFPETIGTFFFGYIFYRNLIPVFLFSKTLLALGSLNISGKKLKTLFPVTFCPRNSENCDFFTEVLFPGFFQKLFFPATFLHKLYVAGNYDYKEAT